MIIILTKLFELPKFRDLKQYFCYHFQNEDKMENHLLRAYFNFNADQLAPNLLHHKTFRFYNKIFCLFCTFCYVSKDLQTNVIYRLNNELNGLNRSRKYFGIEHILVEKLSEYVSNFKLIKII